MSKESRKNEPCSDTNEGWNYITDELENVIKHTPSPSKIAFPVVKRRTPSLSTKAPLGENAVNNKAGGGSCYVIGINNSNSYKRAMSQTLAVQTQSPNIQKVQVPDTIEDMLADDFTPSSAEEPARREEGEETPSSGTVSINNPSVSRLLKTDSMRRAPSAACPPTGPAPVP